MDLHANSFSTEEAHEEEYRMEDSDYVVLSRLINDLISMAANSIV